LPPYIISEAQLQKVYGIVEDAVEMVWFFLATDYIDFHGFF
jgi:hypothetical protein